jgi:phasin family protein
MTTFRQLIQSGPIKANELFAKLADTSVNAVKRREKLFLELKEELELLAELEEKHLFPVLRKHRQTKDLVSDAVEDNRQTRKLLAELDRTPRDSEDFAIRVSELRRVFQQHVRDEKRELLPAVLKALSDEEAQAIVERIEDRKAELEQEKQAEVEERRAVARQEREQAENVQRVTETVVETIWAGPQRVEQIGRTAQAAVRSGMSRATEVAQNSTGEWMQAFGLFGRHGQDFAERSWQTIQAGARANTVWARGVQDLTQEWLKLLQERLQRNKDGFSALSRCRSVPDFMSVQGELLRDSLQQSLESTRRMAEVSTRIADEATRTISTQAREATRQAA